MAKLLLLFLTLAPLAVVRTQEHGARGERARPGDREHRATVERQMAEMTSGPLGVPRSREGSGTSWLPDATPMHAFHRMAGPWELMLHGNAFLQYVDDGSDRGEEQFGSINWLMAMGRRPLAGGDLLLRAMLSLDPLTVGKCGYPDLLATGEFCHGQPLHDRQHPHDLFMELVAGYERALTQDLAFQVYGGPVGEPALGPVAFPHRPSAWPNPLAPISHHWLDSTHITFGVVTAGLFGRRWKLEGSAFNGREPDEDRYDVNLDALDSYSGRIWWLPNERWALQASIGRLNDAEPARDGEPPEDITRPTASITYHTPLPAGGSWASTLAWGANVEEEHTTHALLAESSLELDERNVLFGRGEIVGKAGRDLALEEEGAEERLLDRTFTVGTIAAGYVRQLGAVAGLVPGVGARLSLNVAPEDLEPFYGSATSVGFAVFASLRPAPMRMGAAHEMDHSARQGGMRMDEGHP